MAIAAIKNQAATRWFTFAVSAIVSALKPISRIFSDFPFSKIKSYILNTSIDTLQNKPSSRGISDLPSSRITTYKPTIR